MPAAPMNGTRTMRVFPFRSRPHGTPGLPDRSTASQLARRYRAFSRKRIDTAIFPGSFLSRHDRCKSARVITTSPPHGAPASMRKIWPSTPAGSVIRGSGQLGAVDVETGAAQWQVPGGFACGPVLASRNAVFERSGSPVFIDLRTREQTKDSKKRWRAIAGIRPTCAYPALPAYGMLYVQAVGCRCNIPLRGLVTMAPGEPAEPEPENRLVKGEAYDQPVPETDDPHAWRTWRGDACHTSQ